MATSPIISRSIGFLPFRALGVVAMLFAGVVIGAAANPASAQSEPMVVTAREYGYYEAVNRAPDEIARHMWTAAFSSDGKSLVVTSGWDESREAGRLVVWDLETKKPKFALSEIATIRCAAFSPDGTLVAAG